MTSRRSVTTLFATLILAAAVCAQAAGPANTATRTPTTRGTRGLAGVISSPTLTCISCAAQPTNGAFLLTPSGKKQSMAFSYNSTSVFTLDGAATTGSALRSGLHANVQSKTLDNGTKLATTVVLTSSGLAPTTGVKAPALGH